MCFWVCFFLGLVFFEVVVVLYSILLGDVVIVGRGRMFLEVLVGIDLVVSVGG